MNSQRESQQGGVRHGTDMDMGQRESKVQPLVTSYTSRRGVDSENFHFQSLACPLWLFMKGQLKFQFHFTASEITPLL